MKKRAEYTATRNTPENYRYASACLHCIYFVDRGSRCGLPDAGSREGRPSIEISVLKAAVCDRFIPVANA